MTQELVACLLLMTLCILPSGTDVMLSFLQDSKAEAIRWKFYILYIFLKLSGKLE